MSTYTYYDLEVSEPLHRYKDYTDDPQPLERAYVPIRTVRPRPSVYPAPMPSHVYYTYPPYGESTMCLIPGPHATGNERPAEEEGGLKGYLSLAVEALNAVATIIGACMQ
jgi:hypothetical protein